MMAINAHFRWHDNYDCRPIEQNSSSPQVQVSKDFLVDETQFRSQVLGVGISLGPVMIRNYQDLIHNFSTLLKSHSSCKSIGGQKYVQYTLFVIMWLNVV